MYYIGSNFDTCTLYGINANRVKQCAFAFSGFMSALCGAFKTARFAHAAPDTGSNLEILVITAAVLGVVFLHEKMTPGIIAGAILILIAIVLPSWIQERAARKDQTKN